ncbi:MAG: ferredoxin family protein, partial [Pseudonocardia sp.]|nr:ferredoxin family protein [Pseudonocardia sp.]
TQDRGVAEGHEDFVEDNARFFDIVLPGRDDAIGAPGGASGLGPIGADTDLVARFPRD